MKVAILFSGGKDSTFAVDFAKEKGWDIEYLLSVKPTRTDCFLFHFATVEMTKELSNILGLKHIYTTCDVADPAKEAQIVKEIVEKNPVDAVVLGGTGLQMTQIKSIQDALRPLGIEVFAAHAGLEHDDVMREMLKNGYRFMITQVASYGLNKDWLGRVLDNDSMKELFDRAEIYGFHNGGEGGYYDTLAIDGPIFSKRLEVEEFSKNMESENAGHLVVTKAKVVDKIRVRE
ncbi:diphthine--ammonia ligase [Nanoarchaeota archaeon]